MMANPTDPSTRDAERGSHRSGLHGDEGFVFTRNWALKQVAKVLLLALLILFAMRESDLDARSREELRARRTFLTAVRGGGPEGAVTPSGEDVERARAAYLAVCGECATESACRDAARQIATRALGADGRGPCPGPWLGTWLTTDSATRWSSSGSATGSKAPAPTEGARR
jgi:hypothetical protein